MDHLSGQHCRRQARAGQVVDWMGEDIPACVAPAEGETGTTALLVMWPEKDLLVEARAEADEPTSPDAVRSALITLAEGLERLR